MHPDFKRWTEFLSGLGIADVPHTQENYFAHLVNVYRFMESYAQDDVRCRAGLFHSIYGTEKFQGFKLPLSDRDKLAGLIGDRAERLAYWNCLMDRSSLDALLDQPTGPYVIRNRETGEAMTLSLEEFDDLCAVHLFDWLEQAPRSHFGWDYRRTAYRRMAERLGRRAIEAYDKTFVLEGASAPNA